MTEKVYIESPHFTGRNAPIAEIAKMIGKDDQYSASDFKKASSNLDVP